MTKPLTSTVFNLFASGTHKSVHKQKFTTTFNRCIPLAYPTPLRKSYMGGNLPTCISILPFSTSKLRVGMYRFRQTLKLGGNLPRVFYKSCSQSLLTLWTSKFCLTCRSGHFPGAMRWASENWGLRVANNPSTETTLQYLPEPSTVV